MKKFKILGIDQSITCTGLSLLSVEDTPKLLWYGSIKSPKTFNYNFERFENMLIKFRKILTLKNPDIIAFERAAFGFASQTNKIILYEYTGLLKQIAGLYCKVDPLLISPMSAKKIITGSGRSKKDEVRKKIEKLYNIKLKGKEKNDVSDSIAIAITAIKKHIVTTNNEIIINGF